MAKSDRGASAESIARWAEARGGAVVPGLSRTEQWQIVKASERAGVTMESLAREFGRSETEIGHVLADWTDTTPAAKRLLKARALALAERMIADADPGVALDILERLAVVEPKQRGGGETGITVLVGNGGAVNFGPVPGVIDVPPRGDVPEVAGDVLKRGSV